MKNYDVIFIGAGVMACAIAYHLLKEDKTLQIALIEKDPSYKFSSTVLSDGNIRTQFNTKENILISLYGLKMLETFSEELAVGDKKPHVQFRKQGNLFLCDDAGRETSLAGLKLQQSLGAAAEWLDSQAVHERYPFIDPKTIAGGVFGANDGSMDPYSVLLAYKDKSIDLGAAYLEAEVTGVLAQNGRVEGVTLANGEKLTGRIVVNSAGAWCLPFAQSIGVDLPVQPVMRHVFHIETPVSSDKPLPLIVFPSGLYIHHENANHFVSGKSLGTVDPIGFDFSFNRALFLDYFWEELAYHMPQFEHLKLIDGWTGLYDVNTFDGNAILGESPQVKGFYLVNGFSGHGFQQCHAVGAYLADCILEREPRLDLAAFSPERLLTGKAIQENSHKLV